MAYTYKKLTDVELVESTTEPNILIEDGGDVKKISASNLIVPQVQVDWNEDDMTNPAFIMNKPNLSEVGGGANVVTYTINSGALQLNGATLTTQEVVDEWNNGSILRIKQVRSGTEGSTYYTIDESPVISIHYQMHSGSLMASINYYDIDSQTIKSIYC